MFLPFTNHPQINAIVQRFNEEEHYFLKIHRMIDLVEVLIKTHTAYIISDYFRIKDISENIKGLLANGLITPSLGIWKVFGSAILEDIMIKKVLLPSQFEQILSLISKEQRARVEEMYYRQGDNYHLNKFISLSDRTFLRKKVFKKNNYEYSEKLFLDSFIEYYFTWENMYLNEKIFNGTKKIDNVISLRNKYAHGASPSKSICEEDLKAYFPVLQKMLEERWLHETTIIVIDEEGNTVPFHRSSEFREEQGTSYFDTLSIETQKSLRPFTPYLVKDNQVVLSQFPILSYKYLEEDGHSIVFFNDAKKYESSSISLLDYSSGLHIHEQEAFGEFKQIINITEWKSLVTEDFEALIKQKRENFYGREDEQQTINEIIHKSDRGFLSLFGDPGIGKSTIMAQMVHHLMSNNNVHVIEYFFERGSRISTFLTTIHNKLNAVKNTGIPIGRTVEEMQMNLYKKLSIFSLSPNQRKLIFFLDGLDTGLQEDPTLLHFLPARVYRNVFFVFSSRRTSEAIEYYKGLPSEYVNRYDLNGMNNENIRALLYKVVNKYEITDQYIQALTIKSDGNPLYMNLLCNAIENGEIPLNNNEALPQLTRTNQFDHFYHQILNRYTRKPNGKELLNALYTFAATKDYLSTAHLVLMLDIEASDAMILLEDLGEVLSEHPNKRGFFQLFHESLREFLFNKERHLINKQVKVILAFCQNRNNLTIYDNEVLSYIYKHYPSHLLDFIKSNHFVNVERDLYHRKFEELVMDDSFIEAQIEITGEYGYSFSCYKQAFQLYEEQLYNQNKEIKRKMVYLAVKVGQLHLRVLNSSKEILGFNQFHNLDELRLVLERLKYLTPKEQAVMYICLLYKCLQDQVPWKKCVNLILEHMNKHSIMDPAIVNWNDFIPKNIYVWVLVKCYKLKNDYSSLLLRFRITHYYELQEIDHLLKMYHKEHRPLMDEVVLNMVNDTSFVVAYFVKQVEYEALYGSMVRVEKLLTTIKEYCRQFNNSNEKASLLAVTAKRLQDLGLEEYFKDFAATALTNIKESPDIYDKPLLLLNVITEWQESLALEKVEQLYSDFILLMNTLPQNHESLRALVQLLITLANLKREDEVNMVYGLIEGILRFIPTSRSMDYQIGGYLEELRLVQNVPNQIRQVLHKVQISHICKIFDWLFRDNELCGMVKILSRFGDFTIAEALIPKVEDLYSRGAAVFYIFEEESKRGGFTVSLKILEEHIILDEKLLVLFQFLITINKHKVTYNRFLTLLPNSYNRENFPLLVISEEELGIEDKESFNNREELDYVEWEHEGEEDLYTGGEECESAEEYEWLNEDPLEDISLPWNKPVFNTSVYQQYRKNYKASFDEITELFFTGGLLIPPEKRGLNQSFEHLTKMIKSFSQLPVSMVELDFVGQSHNSEELMEDKIIDVPKEFPDDWEWIVQKVSSYYGTNEDAEILSAILKEFQIRTFVNAYNEYELSEYYFELVCLYVILRDLRKKGNDVLLLRISKDFMKLFKRINNDGNENFTYLGIEDGDLLENFAIEYIILGESSIAAHLADFTINPYSSDFSERLQELLRKTCNLLVTEQQWNEVLKIISKIKDVSYQMEIRKQIAIGLSKDNNIVVENIFKIVEEIKEINTYYETIGEVAISFFYSGNKAKYKRFVQLLPKGPYLEYTLSKVAIILATEGEVVRSHQVIMEISDEFLREQTIKELVPLMLQQKRFKGAVSLMGIVSNEGKLKLLEELLVVVELAEVLEIVEYVETYILSVEIKEFFYKQLLKVLFQKKEYEQVLWILLGILHRVIENSTLLGQTLYQIAFLNAKLLNPDYQIYNDIEKVVNLETIESPEEKGMKYVFHNLVDWIETLNPLLKLSIQVLRGKVERGEISENEFDFLVSKYLTHHP